MRRTEQGNLLLHAYLHAAAGLHGFACTLAFQPPKLFTNLKPYK